MERIKYKKSRNIQPNYYEYTGHHKTEPVDMQLFVYDDSGYEEYQHVSIEKIKAECDDPAQHKDVKWLNVHGLHDTARIRALGEMLDLEPFIISDILNVVKRPKLEELDNVLFFSIKSVLPSADGQEERVEQLSFVLKDKLLVSFQEKKSDFFIHIRERIKTHAGIVRKKKNDYLLYLLLESVMENFYITIEFYEDRIDDVMAAAKVSDRREIHEEIQRIRSRFGVLKRSIQPLHDALYLLKSIREEDEFNGIDKSNYAFFARLNQKSLELLEQIEYDMNSLDSAANFYFASQSRRMNEIMKVLTGVSVIFMPLTFIVGVYGMNFDYMPELRHPYGYFTVLAVMFFLVVGMVVFFKKKRWF
ncbi:magnesium/cobalt transporter CorA [Flavobacterium caeni]|uniref:Magnesium transport protein CorA n=1 Tax=Flavobacterium caeni TaxID=490189 RepID=A0A1G5ATQ7_9FLAO|nr:magnesium/cobalt transporter CorA [Flavobacterium caeni]SCX81292.1 magnesium transporter [Flavobacterium caeni]